MNDENKPLNKKDTNRLNHGRGLGSGEKYVPFIKVGEFSSSGESIRVKGNKTNRIHHFHSGIELALFFVLNWSNKVEDIREQFPIPLIDSLNICKSLGIRHPQTRGELSIVTTDFVVDFVGGGKCAFAVKPSKQLDKNRVKEKLQIELCYWESRGYDWKAFTEKEVTQEIKVNLKWLKPFLDVDNKIAYSITTKDCIDVISRLSRAVSNDTISKFCAHLDDSYKLNAGFHIEVFRYLVSQRYLTLPLTKTFHDWHLNDIEAITFSQEIRGKTYAS